MAAGGQVGGGGEVGAIPGVRGGPGQSDRQVCFAGPGRADQQDVGRRFEVAAGAEFVDQLAVDAGGGVEVEVVQGGRGGQAGEPQPAGQSAGVAGVDFDGQQPFQGGGQRQAFGGGLVQDGRQRFGGGVQFELGQVRAQLLIPAGRG